MKANRPPSQLAQLFPCSSVLSGAWLLSLACALGSLSSQCAASFLPGPRGIQTSHRNPVLVGTQQFSMQCAVPTLPEGFNGLVEYVWYFKGLGQVGYATVWETPSITFQGGRKLVISTVTLEHAGSYLCSVRFGSSSSTGRYVGTIPNGNWPLKVTTLEQLPHRQPRIQSISQVPSGVISLAETHLVRFLCLGNNETDTYSWEINQQPLAQCSGRFRLLRPSQSRTLILHNVSISDHGAVVRCIANASSGKTDTRTFPPLQVHATSNGPTAKPITAAHATQKPTTNNSPISSTTRTTILPSFGDMASPTARGEDTATESNDIETMADTGDERDLQEATSPSDKANIPQTAAIAVGSTVIVACIAITAYTLTKRTTSSPTTTHQQTRDQADSERSVWSRYSTSISSSTEMVPGAYVANYME